MDGRTYADVVREGKPRSSFQEDMPNVKVTVKASKKDAQKQSEDAQKQLEAIEQERLDAGDDVEFWGDS